MKKIDIWVTILSTGSGGAELKYFFTEKQAIQAEENQYEGDNWEEPCYEMVETFIGSNIHKKALIDTKKLEEELNG